MNELFELFVRERRYLKNVSPATIDWYQRSYAAFGSALAGKAPNDLNKAVFLGAIECLKDRGIRAVSINTYSRCMNAFLRWLHEEGHAPRAPHGSPRSKPHPERSPTFDLASSRLWR